MNKKQKWMSRVNKNRIKTRLSYNNWKQLRTIYKMKKPKLKRLDKLSRI